MTGPSEAAVPAPLGGPRPDTAPWHAPREYRTAALVLQPPALLPLDAEGYRAAVAALARLFASRLPHDDTHHG